MTLLSLLDGSLLCNKLLRKNPKFYGNLNKIWILFHVKSGYLDQLQMKSKKFTFGLELWTVSSEEELLNFYDDYLDDYMEISFIKFMSPTISTPIPSLDVPN